MSDHQKTVELRNGLLFFKWDDSYKLSKIAESNGFIEDLPCPEQRVSFDTIYSQDNILVFSEFGGSRMDFIHCYQNYLDEQGIKWLLVKADYWDSEAFNLSKDFGDNNGLLAIIDNLGKTKTSDDTEINIGEKIKALKNWLNDYAKIGEKIVLMIRDISLMEKKSLQDITVILRQVYDLLPDETKENIKLSILIMDTQSRNFLDTAEASGYAPLCHQYRLPFLNKQEIGELIREKFNTIADTCDDDILNRIYDFTGGQLLLVQELLRRLTLDAENQINTKELNRMFRHLRNSPPQVAKKWQDELGAILTADPSLILPMQAYTKGYGLSPERQPAPLKELYLFLAGWLKPDRLGYWGISSSLHASLASAVLDKLVKDNKNA